MLHMMHILEMGINNLDIQLGGKLLHFQKTTQAFMMMNTLLKVTEHIFIKQMAMFMENHHI